MILVVVLTVLLSMIGLMFILASRIEQATSLSANVDRDLAAGVDSVTVRINKVLVDDLFGPKRDRGLCDGDTKDALGNLGINERFDYAGDQDRWLSSLSPEWDERPPAGVDSSPDDVRDDVYDWRHLSDLYYDVLGVVRPGFPGLAGLEVGWTVGPNLYSVDGGPFPRFQNNMVVSDADGDGVWDSIWVKLPNISTAKGEPIYSAVRIIDNCAMLNLNTAFKLEATSEGQYLSAVDYERFRRGNDRDNDVPANDILLADRIRRARMVDPAAILDTVQQYHDRLIMNIEKPDPTRYRLFDLTDELEIRNRFLLTSGFEARFERPDISNRTFDAGGNSYAVKMIPFNDTEDDDSPFTVGGTTYTRTSFDGWKIRMNQANFDDKSGANYNATEPKLNFRWEYDRRHVCTFYSFDRNIRSGPDLVLDPVVQTLRTDYQQELDQADKADKLIVLNTVRSVFWAPNGSTASTRDLVIANTPESRKAILQLLYALRAYYLRYGDPTLTVDQIKADLADPKHPKQLLSKAARKAAQTVANMIDYLDDTSATTPGPFFDGNYGGQRNPGPTFIDETLVRQLVQEVSVEVSKTLSNNTKTLDISSDARYAFGLGSHVVYGYERQPFLAEIYREFNGTAGGNVAFAIELCNPYKTPINLNGWQIRLGKTDYPLNATFVVPAGDTNALGRLILWGASPGYTVPLNGASNRQISNFGIGIPLVTNDSIVLHRPVPDIANPTNKVMLAVDWIPPAQVNQILAAAGTRSSKRDDRNWCFAVAASYITDVSPSLGQPNNATIPSAKKGYQMPVADDNTATVSKPIATLGDFDKILTIGSEWISAADPNAVTSFVGLASNEGDVRTDIVSAPEILGYVGFLNRPAGNLPGRININSASKEVIRAAIPPKPSFVKTGDDPQKFADDLATAIARTGQAPPFSSLADLVDSTKFPIIAALLTKWVTDSADNVGDPSMTDDIEERDWILSRLSNIFTVRSDTFTAYIAVRIGAPRYVINNSDPKKTFVDIDADRRYIAIFDRSAVDQPDQSPRLLALHPVPDPR